MKKVLLLSVAAIVLAATVAGTASAQTQKRVQIGARAGIFSQDMELTASDFVNKGVDTSAPGYEEGSNVDHYATEGQMGFYAAVVSRIRLTNIGKGRLDMGLYFQPEVIFSQNSYKIQQINLPDGSNGEVSRIRMQSVDIPLMLSFKISIVRLQGGVNFNVMWKNRTMSGQTKITPVRPTFGWTVGASVDIVAGLVLDGRYTANFKEVRNHIGVGSGDNMVVYDNVRGKLTNWSLGLSYLF